MIMSSLCLSGAILALLLAEAGVLGANLGALAPMTGFLSFLLSLPIAIVALLFGSIALTRASATEHRLGRRRTRAGMVLALLVAAPIAFTIWRWWSMPYPAINDITTDYENPPQFVDPPGLSAASMNYERARLEPIQTRCYPKLGPLRLDEKPDDAFARVKAAADAAPLVGLQMTAQIPPEPGWSIVYVDPGTRTIEGVETSQLFHFRDDFVIQVRAGSDLNTSLVEMRSRSREGWGDFGVNYDRIREFFAVLEPGASRAALRSQMK
jgi:hypothetical protein